MPLPYNLNFPESLDFMRNSQPLMLQNYASIFTFIIEDHAGFNDPIDTPGEHLQMTFPQLTATPPVNPTASLPILFTQASPSYVGGDEIALFIQNSLNVINGFSEGQISEEFFDEGLPNWIVLPSGIILKWVFVPEIQNDNPVQTYTWLSESSGKPFTQQFWSIVIPLQGSPARPLDDSNSVAYVTSLTPTQVNYAIWQKALFNNHPDRGINPAVIIFSIGV